MGLPGKPKGFDSSEAGLPRELITEVADYCETDVVNTYRVWLRYELFGAGERLLVQPQGKATLHEISRITRTPTKSAKFLFWVRFGSRVSRARGLASIVPPPSARIGLLNEN